MKFLYACAALALTAPTTSAAAADDKKSKQPPPKPCTIHSTSTGGFFDLNSLHVQLPKKDAKPAKKEAQTESWHARGYDYGANFTLNFCGPVVEELERVEGVDKSLWRDVSAYYTMDRKTYSMGQQNSELVFRGRKLVLNYTGGSPCDTGNSKRDVTTDLTARKLIDGDDDDDNSHKQPAHNNGKRRKSTIISLLCEREPLALKSPRVTVAFVGASEDQCTYFFEARSPAACAGMETTPQQLGPGGVFGVIMFIALLVYLGGGCVYQRTVMNQRGLRQLPNYSMWAGIFGFLVDMVVILTSSCARFLPGRRGYNRVSLNGGNSRNRGIGSDDENRLIDQLDEEWDD